MAGDKDKLGVLGELLQQSDQDPPSKTSGEEQLAHDAERILKLAEQLAGENLFDMQVLIEFCAEEIRSQIRDEVEGDDP